MNSLKNLLILILISVSFFANAQRTQYNVISQSIAAQSEGITQRIPLEVDAEFYTLALNIDFTDLQLSDLLVRFSTDKITWNEWNAFEIDPHGENNLISNLIYIPKEMGFFQMVNLSDINANIQMDFYSPGISSVSDEDNSYRADCIQPKYKNRNTWCTTCPAGGSTITTVTHLVVHHSAGVNSSSDWDAVVRGIWNYHVNTKGWDDVGYNWLIAPTGDIYEGRLDNIQGAHYCAKNGHTMGMCMMGDYTDITPTDTMKASLVKLLAWKADKNDIEPLGSSYHTGTGGDLKNIIGHRDGCSTECPGASFYPILHNEVKPMVDELIQNKCADQVVDPEEEEPDPEPEVEYYDGPFVMRPNITSDKIGFFGGKKLIHPIRVTILNIAGQVVQEHTYVGRYDYFEEEFDVSFYPRGTYFVFVNYGINEHRFRFVKI